MRYPICAFHWLHSIRHFRDDKGIGAEMRPAIVAGIVSLIHCPIISLAIAQKQVQKFLLFDTNISIKNNMG